jgi:hypothetical protein
VGPACQRLSRHAPRPDWLPGVALPSRPHHKGTDRSDRPLCPKPHCLAVRASRRHRCPNPATIPAGKRRRAAFCSKVGHRASLPSVAAPDSPCRAAAPHAVPPSSASRRVLAGAEELRLTPFWRCDVGRLQPPGPRRRCLG